MFANYKMSTLLASLLLVLAIWIELSACQRGLTRSQRQTVTSELASGLTGTGTSFNSLYGDPYQQQSILSSPYDGLDGYSAKYPGSSLYNNNNNNRYHSTLANSYDNYAGGYGANTPFGAGFNSAAGYGTGYGTGYANGPLGTSSWAGFGYGKGYGKRPLGARYPATSGVKY